LRTIERGVSAALGGLVISVAVAALLLGLALWAGGVALLSVAFHAFGGVAVWIATWLVELQRRQVALEERESEELRGSSAQRGTAGDTRGSLLGMDDDALVVARRRLDRFERVGLSLIGLAVALWLVVTGTWSLSRLGDVASAATREAAAPLTLAFVLCATSFVAFVASRFFAGMASTSHWRILRGGAGWLVGSSLLTIAVSIACFVLAGAEIDTPLRAVNWCAPLLMVALGVEIALNLVLGLYRPRRSGELVRPAFDSRLLGVLAAPGSVGRTISDAINYQFGFEVTHSWFWRLLERTFGRLAAFAVVVLLLLSTVVVVDPWERAIVTRFGRISGDPLGPGLHFKLPWPISRAELWDVGRVRTIHIGSDIHLRADVPVLWANEHTEHTPEPLIVAAPSFAGGAAGPAEDTDRDGSPTVALVHAQVSVHYRVHPDRLVDYVLANVDAAQYERDADATHDADAHDADHGAPHRDEDDHDHDHGHDHGDAAHDDGDDEHDDHSGDVDALATGPDARLRHIAAQELTRYLLAHDIDGWLGEARHDAGGTLQQRVQQAADDARLGIEVLDVAVASLHPPREVADAFHAVVMSEQEKATAIEASRRTAIRTLAEAAGSVEKSAALVTEIEAASRLRRDGDATRPRARTARSTGCSSKQAGSQPQRSPRPAPHGGWPMKASAASWHASALRPGPSRRRHVSSELGRFST